MGKNDDAEDLEDDIVTIKNEYRCDIEKKARKAFVVKAAGKYYADVIRHEILRKRTTVTAEDLIEAMTALTESLVVVTRKIAMTTLIVSKRHH